MQLYKETLPKVTADVLAKMSALPLLKKFYLSGGTALALQLGHRESEDLDFFAKEKFDPQVLQQQLTSSGKITTTSLEEGTLNTYMNDVKLQFLYYPYTLLEESRKWNGVYLSSVVDIACTKLITISMRGSKKDFIDLYIILQNYSLDELLIKLDEKYQQVNYSKPHILKSLIYFDDANVQPMPRMHIPLAWETVKQSMIEAVKTIRF